MRKVTIQMRVAVHPIRAKLWREGYVHRRIKPGMSLRDIGKLVNMSSPQVVKHHLESMVKMGAIDYVGGNYLFPKNNKHG